MDAIPNNELMYVRETRRPPFIAFLGYPLVIQEEVMIIARKKTAAHDACVARQSLLV